MLVAIKVVVGALVLLLPLGVMRLDDRDRARLAGGAPRLRVLVGAQPVWGLDSYVMGMVLTLWALAWLIEVETVKGALRWR